MDLVFIAYLRIYNIDGLLPSWQMTWLTLAFLCERKPK